MNTHATLDEIQQALQSQDRAISAACAALVEGGGVPVAVVRVDLERLRDLCGARPSTRSAFGAARGGVRC